MVRAESATRRRAPGRLVHLAKDHGGLREHRAIDRLPDRWFPALSSQRSFAFARPLADAGEHEYPPCWLAIAGR